LRPTGSGSTKWRGTALASRRMISVSASAVEEVHSGMKQGHTCLPHQDVQTRLKKLWISVPGEPSNEYTRCRGAVSLPKDRRFLPDFWPIFNRILHRDSPQRWLKRESRRANKSLRTNPVELIHHTGYSQLRSLTRDHVQRRAEGAVSTSSATT
jgi:hypothetical protein